MLRSNSLWLLFFFGILQTTAWSQGFNCDQAVYALGEESNNLVKIEIDPNNVALVYTEIIADLGIELEALAFRSTDQKLYAISTGTKELYQIDGDLNVNLVANLGLSTNFDYEAGEIDRTGNNYYVIKSSGNNSESLIRINLSNNTLTELPLLSGFKFLDITLSPHDNWIYGYDENDERVIRFNLAANDFLGLNPIKFEDTYQFLFTDDLGRLWGIGLAVGGVASGMFNINEQNGQYGTWVTGPENYMKDGTSCPYGISMIKKADPKITIPCTEIEYTLIIGNGGGTVSNLDLETQFSNGFDYISTDYNPYFSNDISFGSNFELTNLSIPQGVDSIVYTVELGDIPGGEYKMQSRLYNSTNAMIEVLSDNENTRTPLDSNLITVNRIEEDSLFENRFLCLGETIILDASEYSGVGIWNNGVQNPQLEVSEGGQYRFQAFSECQSFVVVYDVVIASCPFTIAIDHRIIPNQTLPCSEVIFQYAFENSSGVTQYNLDFYDTLRPGFQIVDITRNPWPDKLNTAPQPEILHIQNFDLGPGTDTLEMIVYVDDINPGVYPNRSKLVGFPIEIGPFRESDDPDTPLLDSTRLEVIGTVSDSVYIEIPLCEGDVLTLNGSPFGVDFLWPNGSTDSLYIVDEIGVYELQVFSGCQVSYVFFDVFEGLNIEIEDDFFQTIRLGDSLLLDPQILNLGDSLNFMWTDFQDTTMRCDTCLQSFAMPLRDNTYKLYVENEECKDSVYYEITVDNSRRIYVPNVFSPNRDGNNDILFIQTPDFALIRSFEVYDRWGNRIFMVENMEANDSSQGWRGEFKNFHPVPGVYVWRAEIYFLDKKTEVFSGDIAILP